MHTRKGAASGGYKVACLDGEHPLQQWTKACEQFCELRNQVNRLIRQRLASRANETGTPGFVSQCSVAQLIILEMDMTKELENLLTDMNRRKGSSFPKKIMKHVAILQDWNQRAQHMMNLAGQSTC
jgi:hypothetical protein